MEIFHTVAVFLTCLLSLFFPFLLDSQGWLAGGLMGKRYILRQISYTVVIGCVYVRRICEEMDR